MTSQATEATPVWVLGASGLLVGELLRLVEQHDGLVLRGAISREGGKALGELHPHLAAARELRTIEQGAAAADVRAQLSAGGRGALVLGLPHGHSAAAWRELREELGDLAERLHVVDLSADYRLHDVAAYERWYKQEHADPEGLRSFAYGLPELHRGALRGCLHVAAPGCFATALQLACVPAAEAGILEPERPWILNAVTGSSGSGSHPKAGTHHPHRDGNLWAYGLAGHRHEAELEQALAPLDLAPPIHFQPHSGPFVRGIHLTAYLPLAQRMETAEAVDLYTERFDSEPFVEVLDSGVPDLRRVVGSNRVALGASVRGDVLTVLLCLDNVIKGGAGQALQCLNLQLDLPEERGLPRAGLGCL